MSDLYLPSAPQTVSVRPLNLGQVNSMPSVAAKEESFKLVDGYDTTERGLRKHGGWQPLYKAAGLSVAIPTRFDDGQTDSARHLGERLEDMFHMWLSTGDTRVCVITSRLLYILDFTTGYTPAYWCRTYSVASYNGAGSDGVITMTGSWVTPDLLAADDWVELDDGGTVKLFKVRSVAAPSTVTLVGKPTNAPAGASTFKMLKPFQATGDYYVDYTVGRGKAYFVDNFSPLAFQYDGTWLSPLVVTNTDGTRNLYGARTVAYYKERLYFGAVRETSGAGVGQTQRTRWTEVLDWTKSADANYQDLSFRQGPLMKLLGYGDLLVAYMTDAVYYGRQTNLTNLPYAFYLMETAGIAPTGMKAICSFIDGQVFVGPDDVYYLTTGPKIEAIGSAVASIAFRGLAEPGATRICADLVNSRIVVAVGRTSATLAEMYFWNYKSKGWSSATGPSVAFIAALSATDQFYISELSPTDTFENSPLTSMPLQSFFARQGVMNIMGALTSGHVMFYDRDATTTVLPNGAVDVVTTVYGRLVTQDMEFGLPGDDKSVLELALRTDDLTSGRTEDIRFAVEGSTDLGRTWRYLGTLRIVPGDDEDAINFRLTGSAIAFRLTTGIAGSTADTRPAPYEVAGYALRVRKRGPEAQRATTRP